MRLSSIAIDGYGIFHDTSLSGLPDGLILVQGDNEAGKTTLLSFIHTILFGFPPRKSSRDYYPALEGGAHGGRLGLVMANGNEFNVERKAGPHGGPVTVTDADGAVEGKEALTRLLAGATADLFRNIYGFSLRELEEFDTLQGDNVKGAIYGASIGTAMLALPKARSRIEKRLEDLFKPGGQKPLINEKLKALDDVQVRLRQARSGIAQYDEACTRLKQVRKDIARLQHESAQTRAEEKKLDSYIGLWPQWVELQRLEKGLDEEVRRLLDRFGKDWNKERLIEIAISLSTRQAVIGHSKGLEEAESGLRQSEGKLNERRDDLAEAELDEASAVEQLEKLERSESVVDEKVVRELEAGRKAFAGIIADLPGVQSDYDDTLKRLERAIKEIDPKWTPDRVRDFDSSLPAQQKMRSFDASLGQAERDLANAQRSFQEKQADLQARTPAQAVPRWTLAAAAVGLFITGAMTLALGRTGLAMVCGSVLALGTLSFAAVRAFSKRSVSERRERLELARETLKTTEKRRENLRKEWENHLKSLYLDPSMDPSTASRVFDKVARAGDLINTVEACEKRLDQMNKARAQYRALGEQIPSLAGSSGDADPEFGSAVDAFLERQRALREARRLAEGTLNERRARKKRAQALLSKAKQHYDEARKRSDETLKAWQDWLAECRLPSDLFPDTVWQAFDALEDCMKGVAQKEENILVLAGETDLEALKESLRGSQLEELESRRQESAHRAKDMEQRLEALRNDRADIETKLKQMRGADDIARLRAEEEGLLAEIQNAAFEWRRYAVAGWLLQKACERFEKEQQPGVIRDAGAFFKRITAERYSEVLAPIGEDTIEVAMPTGKRKKPEELSRGTAEQLYLALRFGYISHRTKEAEPLPIVMDEILVNFDPDRAERAAEAIFDLAAEHQILFFTCHPEIAGLFKALNSSVPCYYLNTGTFLHERP